MEQGRTVTGAGGFLPDQRPSFPARNPNPAISGHAFADGPAVASATARQKRREGGIGGGARRRRRAGVGGRQWGDCATSGRGVTISAIAQSFFFA